jgi:hypothetical protein
VKFDTSDTTTRPNENGGNGNESNHIGLNNHVVIDTTGAVQNDSDNCGVGGGGGGEDILRNEEEEEEELVEVIRDGRSLPHLSYRGLEYDCSVRPKQELSISAKTEY